MPKTATAEYFSKWRSSASVARGVGLDAMGNEFMAKAVELDTKQQKLARDT
jgi:hypothetical protein